MVNYFNLLAENRQENKLRDVEAVKLQFHHYNLQMTILFKINFGSRF
jgi:hypothetical protein